MFKNIEYQIEDNRIEYCDNPGLGFTVKNLAEFSKPYGESIASNQHFYLDNQDGPLTMLNNVRFFISGGDRADTEVTFTSDGAGAGSAVPATVGGTPPHTMRRAQKHPI